MFIIASIRGMTKSITQLVFLLILPYQMMQNDSGYSLKQNFSMFIDNWGKLQQGESRFNNIWGHSCMQGQDE